MIDNAPLSPEVDKWLRTELNPRQELAYRFALNERAEVRADRKFQARIAELREQLQLDEDDLAEIFKYSRIIGEQINVRK